MNTEDHDLCVEDLELAEMNSHTFWAIARALGLDAEIRSYLETISNGKDRP